MSGKLLVFHKCGNMSRQILKWTEQRLEMGYVGMRFFFPSLYVPHQCNGVARKLAPGRSVELESLVMAGVPDYTRCQTIQLILLSNVISYS